MTIWRRWLSRNKLRVCKVEAHYIALDHWAIYKY